MMSKRTLPLFIVVVGALLLAPAASAHESYQTEDGMFTIVLGEQGEPVYTYDWTNLDFIVSEDPVNGTGAPVSGVHETVDATLIAPGGEELSMEIEPQFGSDGRYAFVEDYFLTQPGQYQVRLEGNINGTDVTGVYDLPGPREAMNDRAFPASDVPSLLDLQQENTQLSEEVATLEQTVDDLESQITALQERIDALEANGGSTDGGGSMDGNANGAPGFGALALISVLGLAGVLLRRRA